MHYREHPVTAALADDVACVWMLSAEAGTPPEVQRIVPDGCMELVVHLEDAFSWHDGKRWQKQSPALLFGQLRRPLLLSPGRSVHTLGVRFRPAGARLFFRVELEEIAGAPLPLEEAVGGDAAELQDALHTARTDTQRVGLVQGWLLRRREGRAADPVVRAATAALEQAQGALRVEALAQAAGLSTRQLARRFGAAVGLSPKALARLLRLQAAVRLAQEERATWAEVALACGYSDQAHLIRDFGALTGRPPRTLLAECGAFSREILSPARMDALLGPLPSMSDSSNTAASSVG